MPTEQEISAEDRRYDRAKERIKDRRDYRLEVELGQEGIDTDATITVSIVLEAIIALLAIPEPTLSKGVAIVLAIGVGLFMAFVLVKILLGSRDSTRQIIDDFLAEEKAEDERHERALSGG